MILEKRVPQEDLAGYRKKRLQKNAKVLLEKCVNSFSIQSSSVFMAILAIFFPDCLLAWFCENVNILK